MTVDSTRAPSAHPSEFERALAEYLNAREHLNSTPVDVTREQEDIATAAYYYADARLIEAPATNLSELRAKFDAIWLDPAATPGPSTVLAVFADFRRLTENTVSRLFRPERWLEYFERKGGGYCVRGDEVFLLTPKGANLDGLMFELEAAGGQDAVFDLIRQRAGTEEANDG